MAPQVLVTPRSPAHKEKLTDTTSVAYVLCRIEDDSSLTPVSEYKNVVNGVAAGKHRVEVEDFDFSYGLHADGVRVASFAEGRIGYREWARRNGWLEDIHSIDDRVRVRLAWQRGMMHRYRGENGGREASDERRIQESTAGPCKDRR